MSKTNLSLETDTLPSLLKRLIHCRRSKAPCSTAPASANCHVAGAVSQAQENALTVLVIEVRGVVGCRDPPVTPAHNPVSAADATAAARGRGDDG